MVRPVEIKDVPPYLRAVTILEQRGDIPADVAAAVGRLVRGRRIWSRVAGLMQRSRAARVLVPAASLSLVSALGLLVTRILGGNEFGARVTPLPDSLRYRARAVVASGAGFVVAVAGPHELIRLTPPAWTDVGPFRQWLLGTSTNWTEGKRTLLEGEPTALVAVGSRLMLATRTPDQLVMFSADSLAAGHRAPLQARSIAGVDSGLRVSTDLRSVGIEHAGRLWAVTSDRDGDPALLQEASPGTWEDELILRSGEATIVALSAFDQGANLQPIHLRIAGVRPNQEPRILLDLRNAAAVSMAVGQRSVVVVVRMGDGGV